MGAELHTFVDIFHSKAGTKECPVEVKKIVIPKIQRDYAQGRENPDAVRVRERFLTVLRNAVTGERVTLDFVYGDVDAEGVLTLLDGQQRMTTLFLLHWYVAKKEGIPEEEWRFLREFTYETRASARIFCRELVDFQPDFREGIREQIVDQAWFPLDWNKDPTVHSMLVMLGAIEEKFAGVEGIWKKLKDGAISFYFLPIREMGLTDDLYIKMNSRGKPLTRFEQFKAELEHCLRQSCPDEADRVLSKVDGAWTDLLWRYRGGDGGDGGCVTDDEFLRYYRFACDAICYRRGETAKGRAGDERDILDALFSKKCEKARENLEELESYFDCWLSIPGFDAPASFLESVMSGAHTDGKIIVDVGRYGIDIFEDCLHHYQDRARFPLGRFALLYAVTFYLRYNMRMRQTHQDALQISPSDFARRLRIVNNLIRNSADEVSDRAERNRIPAILSQIEAVILTGTADGAAPNGFNENQLEEEREKAAFLEEHPEEAERLFALEDHPLLKGQISILGLENISLSERFFSLFSCNWDRVDRALMAIGDYGQLERNKWRFQYGSKSMQLAWEELFHKGANEGFEKTGSILTELLSMEERFSNGVLDRIADDFLSQCVEAGTYPWRYYYVKYDEFRPGSYGKLSNGEYEIEPYMYSVMQTRVMWSSNTYMPYLMAADSEHISREDNGQRLEYADAYIVCKNSSYIVRSTEDDSALEEIPIAQNEGGEDTEDRIEKLKVYLSQRAWRS